MRARKDRSGGLNKGLGVGKGIEWAVEFSTQDGDISAVKSYYFIIAIPRRGVFCWENALLSGCEPIGMRSAFYQSRKSGRH